MKLKEAKENINPELSKLIKKAKKRHGNNIKPCAGKKSFKNSTTFDDGILRLWYNDETGSTRLVQ